MYEYIHNLDIIVNIINTVLFLFLLLRIFGLVFAVIVTFNIKYFNINYFNYTNFYITNFENKKRQ